MARRTNRIKKMMRTKLINKLTAAIEAKDIALSEKLAKLTAAAEVAFKEDGNEEKYKDTCKNIKNNLYLERLAFVSRISNFDNK